jgi:hypothetical protein
LCNIYPTEYFEKSVFVDIHLPIRMNGEWLLLICSPFMKENHIVVFNKWGWEHPEVNSDSGENGREAQDPYSKDKTTYSGLEELIDRRLPSTPLSEIGKSRTSMGKARYVMNLFYCPSEPSPYGQTSG